MIYKISRKWCGLFSCLVFVPCSTFLPSFQFEEEAGEEVRGIRGMVFHTFLVPWNVCRNAKGSVMSSVLCQDAA